MDIDTRGPRDATGMEWRVANLFMTRPRMALIVYQQGDSLRRARLRVLRYVSRKRIATPTCWYLEHVVLV